jgi:hypothetical protein
MTPQGSSSAPARGLFLFINEKLEDFIDAWLEGRGQASDGAG